MTVRANQVEVCELGMLPLWPRPTKTLASGTSTNGRGRATAFFMGLMKKPSPMPSNNAKLSTSRRARALPFQTNTPATTRATGRNQPFPLSSGMSRSRTGLLSFRLMKRNTARSMECSHDTGRSLEACSRECQGNVEASPAADENGCLHRPARRTGPVSWSCLPSRFPIYSAHDGLVLAMDLAQRNVPGDRMARVEGGGLDGQCAVYVPIFRAMVGHGKAQARGGTGCVLVAELERVGVFIGLWTASPGF